MKKQYRNIFVLLFSFLFFALQAQDNPQKKEVKFDPQYLQSSGFSVFFSPYSILPVATYWGRVNCIAPSDELAFSASMPISIGGSIGTYGGLLAIDLPLTVEVNVGNQATEDAETPIGAFIGGGYGFNAMIGGGGALRSYGPLTHVGFRATSPFTGRSVTLRFSYLYGIGGLDANGIDYNPNIFGIGAFYNF